MILVTNVCFVLLGAASAVAAVRLFRGPSLADRVIAADLQLTLLALAAGVAAARTGSSTYLRVMLVVAILGFLGTTMAAAYLEERRS